MDASAVIHAETRSWLSTRSWPSRFNFAILLVDAALSRSQWTVIGAVGCPRGQPEMGYMIHHDYFGHGYATEAVAAFLDLYWRFVPSPSRDTGVGAWHEVASPKPLLAPMDHVEALADVANVASHRVLEKCGFRCVGESGPAGKQCPGSGDEDVAYRLDRPMEIVTS